MTHQEAVLHLSLPPRAPVSHAAIGPQPTARQPRGAFAPSLRQGRGPSSAQKIQVHIWGGITAHTPRSKRGMVGKRGRGRLGGPGKGQDWGTSKQSKTLDSTEAGDKRRQPGPSMVPCPSVGGSWPLGARGHLL